MILSAPPLLDEDNTAFWTWGEHGRLAIHHCDDCSLHVHPPAPVCRWCGSRRVGPRAVSGRGHVYSWSHNQQDWGRGLDDDFVYVVVELVEQPGLRISSRLVDVEPDGVSVGLAVVARFVLDGDVWVPLFAPMGQA